METSNCSYFSVNPDFEPYTGVFYHSDRIFLVGSAGRSNDYRTKESVILSKEVSKEFKQTGLSIPGETRCYSSLQGGVFIVNEQFTEKLSFKNSLSSLYWLDIENSEVDLVYNFGDVLVIDIFFKNPVNGYVIVRFSNQANDYGVLSTKNGGVSWDTLKINKQVGESQFLNDTLFFSANKSGESEMLYKLDINTSELSSVDVGMKIKSLKIDEGKVFLFGEAEKKAKLIVYNNEGLKEVQLPEFELDVYPEDLLVYGELIVIVTGRINDKIFDGFGGVEKELYYTLSGDNQWKKVNLSKEGYLGLIQIYKGESVIAYTGRGNLSICEVR